MLNEEDTATMKNAIDAIKAELEDIKSNCCNMTLIQQSVEARVKTNIALDNIVTKISLLERADSEVSKKLDTLYKVMYIGMGAFIVIEAFVLPNILTSLQVGG